MSGDGNQLLALVVEGSALRLEVVLVLGPVVGAEEELTSAGQLRYQVGLGTATVAAVLCSECPSLSLLHGVHGTRHFVSSFRSGSLWLSWVWPQTQVSKPSRCSLN